MSEQLRRVSNGWQWTVVLVILAGAMSLTGAILGQQSPRERGGRARQESAAAISGARGPAPVSQDETDPPAKDAAAAPGDPEELPPYGDRSLPHDEAIRGRVMDRDGEPVADAVVVAGFKDWRTRPYLRAIAARVRSEPDGFFVLGPLERRNYYVLGTGKEGGVGYVTNQMPGAWVDLVLVPGARVAGRLTALSTGEPVADARVVLKDYTFLSETTSDGDGRYVLGPLPPTAEVRYGQQLLVVASGFKPAERTNMVLVGGREYGVDFRLEPGRSLTGKVVDARTLQPVPGAEVAEGWETYHRKTTSKEDGGFELPNVDVAPNLVFTVRAAGYLPQQRQSDGSGTLEFRLDASLSVSGVVRTLKDEPAAGARVYLVRVKWAPGFKPSAINSRAQTIAITDAEGKFVFPDVMPGQVAAVAFHKDAAPGEFGPIEVPLNGPSPEPVHVTLKEGLTVRGEVRDTQDRPIPSIQVRLQRGWGNIPGYKWAGNFIWSENPIWYTDDQGRFTLRGAVPGKHWLTAWDRTYGYAYTVVEGQDGQVYDGIIVSFAGASIEGTFVDADGKPAVGARVYARGPKNTPGGKRSRSTPVDGLGRFRLAGLKEGVYDITGYSPFGNPEPLKDIPAGSGDLLLKLKQARILRGEVISVLSGRALQRFTLTIQTPRSDGRYMRNAWSGTVKTPDGRFERPLTPGTYKLVVKADGHAPREYDRVVVEEGIDPPEVRVTLDAGGGIEGTVKDSGGKPLRGTWVYARVYRVPGETVPQIDWLLGGGDSSDSKGRFFIQGLAPGTYTVEVNMGSRGAARELVVVRGLEMVRQELVLLPTGTVQIKAHDEEGKPVPGIYFQFTDENSRWLGWAQRTNKNGITNSAAMRMGVAFVRAHDPGNKFEADEFTVVIKPNKQVVVEVAMRKKPETPPR